MLPEVGATELLVIAAIALIVVGPKDLPIMMRKLGQFLGRMRSMAQEFRTSFDDLAHQAELDELRTCVNRQRPFGSDQWTHASPDCRGRCNKICVSSRSRSCSRMNSSALYSACIEASSGFAVTGPSGSPRRW